MKNIIFNLFVALMVLFMSVSVCAEENETIVYSFDYSQYNGGNSEDYQYSLDGKNWSNDRTWDLEVGKMYDILVKLPDGRVVYGVTVIPNNETAASTKENEIEEINSSAESNIQESEVSLESGSDIQGEMKESEVLNESDNQAVVSPEFVALVLFGIIFVFVCIFGSVYYHKNRKLK